MIQTTMSGSCEGNNAKDYGIYSLTLIKLTIINSGTNWYNAPLMHYNGKNMHGLKVNSQLESEHE